MTPDAAADKAQAATAFTNPDGSKGCSRMSHGVHVTSAASVAAAIAAIAVMLYTNQRC